MLTIYKLYRLGNTALRSMYADKGRSHYVFDVTLPSNSFAILIRSCWPCLHRMKNGAGLLKGGSITVMINEKFMSFLWPNYTKK